MSLSGLPGRNAREPWLSRPATCRLRHQIWLICYEKKSAAAALDLGRRRRGGQRVYHFGNLRQGVRVQGVVHPASVPAIGDQPRLFQDLEMEGKTRLGRIQRVGHVAHATLSQPKPPQNRDPGAVRQRVEQLDSAFGIGLGVGRHGMNVSNTIDVSRGAFPDSVPANHSCNWEYLYSRVIYRTRNERAMANR